MAGYSGTPLAKKLGFKPTSRAVIVNAPAGYLATLEPLPEGVQLLARAGREVDLIQLFVVRRAELERRFPTLRDSLVKDGALWVSWPKGKEKARVATDLDDHQVREVGLSLGLVDVKVCAVDEVWSGLKFVRRVKDR
jgi:hypothetical protein